MASAEHLLHEAQFAFNSISFGESRANTRNRARAKSLCMKIIHKYPATMEAGEAHAVLRRLGEEAYTSQMPRRHKHVDQAEHHSPTAKSPKSARRHKHQSQAAHHGAKALARAKARTPVPDPQNAFGTGSTAETLDWRGLVALILAAPKALLVVVGFILLFFFGLFGPFLFIPLVALVLFTGPFRKSMNSEQRERINEFIVRANDYIDRQRKT